MTTTKTYWSLLKICYNGKKVPIIPPLLINDKLILDSEVKANHFNHFFFVSQCTPLDNSSKIASHKSQTYITNTKLSSIKFENEDIINIIRSLSIGKVIDHDNISIRILKICDSAILKPLSILLLYESK